MDIAPERRGSIFLNLSRESLVLALIGAAFRICGVRHVLSTPHHPHPVLLLVSGRFHRHRRSGRLRSQSCSQSPPVFLIGGIKALPRLTKHPYLTATGVFLLGVSLHVALIVGLVNGTSAFYRRALLSGHGEFLIEAVLIQDLPHTLRQYEPYVRGRPDRIFLAQKGPGVIAFFYALKVIASAPFVRIWWNRSHRVPTLSDHCCRSAWLTPLCRVWPPTR